MTTATETHHRAPRCLLAFRNRAESCADPLGPEALALWMDYELEAMRFGVDPDTPREELAALVDSLTVEIPAEEHRNGHAEDFVRWGRRGGLATARRYGTAWFSLLARRRWERITAEALSEAFATINGAAKGGGRDGRPRKGVEEGRRDDAKGSIEGEGEDRRR